MKLFKPQQLHSALELNESFSGISIYEQYETSIEGIVKNIINRYDLDTTFYVFAGHRDNGGDALSIARRLIGHGYSLHVYLINPGKELSEHCRRNKTMLEEFGNDLIVEIGKGAFEPPIFNHQSVIIDGILGSGINRCLAGGYKGLVSFINQSGIPVIAIDQPTGVGFLEKGESGEAHLCIQAVLTYSLGAPKYQSLLKDLHLFFGEVVTINMQLHPKAVQYIECEFEQMDSDLIRPLIKRRDEFSEKRDFGHGYLIVGKKGMMGSAVIASQSALRSGIGLLSVRVPECGVSVIQTALPEAICDADKGQTCIESMTLNSEYDAIGIGPGIGISLATQSAFSELLQKNLRPMVIDADGLNIISKQPDLLGRLSGRTILTPHVREFDRLFGHCRSDQERLSKAIHYAAKYQLVIVLKGRYTVVVTDQGKVYFNSTGNCGMSKAGMGDVLTGIILALLSQGYPLAEAAQIGVYLHGLSADIALESHSEISLLPSDICAEIGRSYNKIMNLSKKTGQSIVS